LYKNSPRAEEGGYIGSNQKNNHMNKRFTLGLAAILLTLWGRAQYCNLSGQTPYSSMQPGITNFSLNTINRTSGNSESSSAVLVVTGLSTTVVPGQTYTISITHSEDSQIFPGARNNLRVWIDYNKNFSFTDAGETVLLKDLEAPATTYTSTITIPTTASGTLTLRATAKMSNDAGHTLPTPCNVPADPLGYHGEMEDYLLVVDAGNQGSAPQASFAVSASTLCTTGTMSLTNASTGTPSPTFSWSATPSAGVTFTPSATSANPNVKFTSAGKYTITCVATNSVGSQSASKSATVVACSTVGVNELNGEASVRVFPNPATSFARIEYSGNSECEIRLLNCLGQEILRKKFTTTTDLDLNGLENGWYHVQVVGSTVVHDSQLLILK
jgi:hypothetical protein